MVLPLKMGWRHLLFANWPVDAAVLDAHLPSPLTVDEHDGTGWLSVVPFTNVAVRPRGLPEPFGVRLPELNLRTYVTCDGEPGVYFFSLDAQGVASVLGARVFHHLPYYYARVSLDWDGDRVRFRSRRRHPGARPADYRATYWPTGESFSAHEDALAAFLVERYRFYTQASDGTLRYSDIDHDPWTLYPAAADVETNTLFGANGFRRPEADPTYYYSPGLDVTASRSRRWTERARRAGGRRGTRR
ncbi:MAG: YqjF family protein [Haloplanus sp.]